MTITAGVLGLSKPLFGTDPKLGAALDRIDTVVSAPKLVTNYAANAAITQKEGTVTLSKGSAAAMTVADPTTGTQVGSVGDDGKELTIISKTAFAHVVTVTGGLAGGASNTLTLGAAVGNLIRLRAISGKWYLLPSTGATASTV